METRVEPRALWARIGAIALPVGVILLVAATAVHPSREDVMNHTAVFREYAQTDGWIAIHFAQWLASLVFFGGLVALYFAMTTKREGPTALARFGLGAVGLRWTEYALQSYSNILLGLTLIFFGLAIAVGSAYSRWPGWLAATAGVAWIIHGLMVSYVGRRGRAALTAAPAGPVTA